MGSKASTAILAQKKLTVSASGIVEACAWNVQTDTAVTSSRDLLNTKQTLRRN